MSAPFFIVGPTAVGKTGLAVDVAEEQGAEIVNADAFQVYEGFDLLTAKPTAEQQRRVPHHLVGCVPITEAYNVARYLDAAHRCIDRIFQRGKPVIVVGGSGLYVKALTHGLAPLPPANATLRAELEGSLPADLLARLQTLDPATAAVIDPRNTRRLVRAVEVCLLTGQPFSSFREEWQSQTASVASRGVFLFRERSDQLARIKARLEVMFDQGVVEEVRVSPVPMSGAGQVLGLRQVRSYLAGQMTLAACQGEIAVATRQYAKRQVTWFKRETCFEAVNASERSELELLTTVRQQFLAWRSGRLSSGQGT